MATTATVQTARENAQHVSHLAGIPDVLRHDGEEQLVSATAAKVLPVVDWILSLDDEDDPKGLEARRTVTLTEIIGRFQDALA